VKRYLGWYARRRGVLEHYGSGKVSAFDAGIHDFLCLTCDYRTGVAQCSAAKISIAWPGHNMRTIKRSLAKLERIGWIKRFRTPGKHGNYPILILRFAVLRRGPEAGPDESPTLWLVNGERTTDWRDVQFDPDTEGGPEPRPEDRPECVPEVSPIQEVEDLEEGNKKSKAVKTRRALARHHGTGFKNPKTQNPDERFQTVKERYEAEFKIRNPGINPPFDGSDAKSLSGLLKSQPDQSTETLISWLQNAFDSEGAFPLLPGFRLREFCSNATKYTRGPLKKGGTAPVSSKFSNLQCDPDSLARIRSLVR